LTSAIYEKLPEELYEYDANGNRKAFETGKNNQLLSDGVFDYKYDDKGNRIEKKSKTGETTKYIWDHRNRLIQVIMPKESVAYSYDFANRMTRRNSEFFVHDGWQIVLTLDSEGKVKDRNFWGVGQDELIATNDQFTLCDHLGSVRDVVDSSGRVLNHIEYNAFGKVTKQTGKSDCVFGYTGKMFDDATGLQWNINRWYDAKVGRWISEDPIGFRGKDMNLLRYSANCPIVFIDSDGRTPKIILIGTFGAVMAILGDTLNVIQVLDYFGLCMPFSKSIKDVPAWRVCTISCLPPIPPGNTDPTWPIFNTIDVEGTEEIIVVYHCRRCFYRYARHFIRQGGECSAECPDGYSKVE